MPARRICASFRFGFGWIAEPVTKANNVGKIPLFDFSGHATRNKPATTLMSVWNGPGPLIRSFGWDSPAAIRAAAAALDAVPVMLSLSCERKDDRQFKKI